MLAVALLPAQEVPRLCKDVCMFQMAGAAKPGCVFGCVSILYPARMAMASTLHLLCTELVLVAVQVMQSPPCTALQHTMHAFMNACTVHAHQCLFNANYV